MLIFISEIPLCLNASLFDSYLGENTNTHWHRFWFWFRFRAHCVLTVVKCLFVCFSGLFFRLLFHSGINFQESPRMFHIYHYSASHRITSVRFKMRAMCIVQCIPITIIIRHEIATEFHISTNSPWRRFLQSDFCHKHFVPSNLISLRHIAAAPNWSSSIFHIAFQHEMKKMKTSAHKHLVDKSVDGKVSAISHFL